MSRLALPFALLLLLAGVASADDSPPPRPHPRGYVGVSAATVLVVSELAIEGGFRPIGDAEFLWLHAKVLAGRDDSGDRSSYAYKAALAGVELRSSGRELRAVFGLDVGAARVEYSSEDELQDTSTELVWSWRGGGELVIGPVVVLLGLTGYAREPALPMLTVGIAARF